ncbi:hydrogenase maturation protease [Methylococcus geothermalis]|uniref:Hydrogenase maturation protease n=1 Tax=Methylococcus geothermalis TaxID=2681310 RepID=A0A858Q596_9GAMM|nr:hydrogenase maturation protease [Methylococcus geothermalis]QJD29020.1 hydrogenase maturation protease [Methylococcus geothermalis]
MAGLLIFGYGNPSRGDDALGPLFLEALQERLASSPRADVEFLQDFQLQIEHALDLAGRERVLFVDAHLDCPPPFRFERLVPLRDGSYTTHAVSPQALLEVYRRLNRGEPPPSYLLSIRGERFGLGDALSREAESNLQSALRFAEALISETTGTGWDSRPSGPDQKYGFSLA